MKSTGKSPALEHRSVELAAEAGVRAVDLAIADQCRLNVLWMNAAAGGERALAFEVPGLPLRDALGALFSRVDGSPHDVPVTGRTPVPFADATFDLVTLYGSCPSLSGLMEIRRVLRAGGTALLAAQNRWWHRRFAQGWTRRYETASMTRLARNITEAGFREARPYWVEPSLAIPRNFIPGSRDAVLAFESMRAREFGPDRRRSLMAAGPQRLLYPAFVFVAKA